MDKVGSNDQTSLRVYMAQLCPSTVVRSSQTGVLTTHRYYHLCLFPCTMRMNSLGWESSRDRSRLSKMTTLFKSVHNQTAPYLQGNCPLTGPLHTFAYFSHFSHSPANKIVSYYGILTSKHDSVWNL